MSQDMELWKQVFQELIQEVKPWHMWTLTEDKDLLPNSLKPGWSQYQQWAFARFQCSLCSRSWASSQVQVVFHMHKNGGKPRGDVKMRVFAQRCRRCHQSPFEVPEFTKENISRILNNLVFRILKKCYREGFKSMEEIPTIKEISLEGPHDSNNCEACLQGFCAQSGLSEAVQSPVSPSLPDISSLALGTTILMPSPSRSGTPADAVKGKATMDRVKERATMDTEKGNSTADAVKGRATADIAKGRATADTVKGRATMDIEKGNSTADEVKGKATMDRVKGRATMDIEKGNSTADAVKGRATMANKGEASPQPWHSGSRKAVTLPTHWSPRANTQHHVERGFQVRNWSHVPYAAQNPRCGNLNACCCFFILIIVVVIIVETIQWTST